MRWFTALAVSFLLMAPAGVAADKAAWAGFYTPTNAATKAIAQRVANNPVSVCIDEILAAEQRYDIPDNLLLSIGIQEAGRRMNGKLVVWPWTANTSGEGAFFGSKLALEAHVREQQSRGIKSTDVGCMQINQRWHGDKFTSLEAATDPAINVDYAARFLKALYNETRDWWQAAGRYHSSSESFKTVYLEKLRQNQVIAKANLPEFLSGQAISRRAAQDLTAAVPPEFSWSADLSGSNSRQAGGALSIYSTQTLEPILPLYAEVN